MLVNARRFLIVGVVETLQSSMFGPNTTSSELFIPFSMAVKLQNPNFFFYMVCKIASPEAADEAKAEARFVFRNMRHLGPEEPDTFQIEPIDQYIDQFKAMAAGITVVASGIVAVSLLVGGIGIMNIMLVSVSERTREERADRTLPCLGRRYHPHRCQRRPVAQVNCRSGSPRIAGRPEV